MRTTWLYGLHMAFKFAPCYSESCSVGVELPDYPEHRVQVKYATEHRCGVVIKGPNLTDNISGTDPLKDNLPLHKCTSLDDSPEVITLATILALKIGFFCWIC